jgi:suppressor of G2 allele of SKP1
VQGGASIVDPTAGRADEYPTSHRRQPRDWGQLENEVKKEEEDEQLDGDAGLQKFFRQLYKNADEDTRRAMNKSFQVGKLSFNMRFMPIACSF